MPHTTPFTSASHRYYYQYRHHRRWCTFFKQNFGYFVANCAFFVPKGLVPFTQLVKVREGVNGKKTFSFGHCPNHLNPPPSPQFGQLGPLFSEVKIQDLKVSLELKLLYILYNILYICNLKNS